MTIVIPILQFCMKKELAETVMEQLRMVCINWLTDIKLIGQLGIQRIDSNGNDERGFPLPIACALTLDPLAKVTIEKDLLV